MNERSLASLPDIPPGHRLVPRHRHPTLRNGRVVMFRDSFEIRVRTDCPDRRVAASTNATVANSWLSRA